MTTYVYETIPQKDGEKPECFEIKQSMQDRPLTQHPESGQPVRRVILGGHGLIAPGKPSAKKAESAPARCGCGQGGCCHS